MFIKNIKAIVFSTIMKKSSDHDSALIVCLCVCVEKGE